jgi:hypothetical protein
MSASRFSTIAVRSLALIVGWNAACVAAAPTHEELAKLCAQAEGPAHCARLVEEVQLKRLPGLAVREGPALKVTLYPAGTATFTDTEAANGGRSYSLWDYFSEINAVVLFTTDGDDAAFTLLQRPTGRKTELPADPKLSPDRARLVTADFCAQRCVNELAVWRVTRDGIRKESTWKPKEAWADATAHWLDADTIVVEYTAAGAASAAKLQRRLGDPGWTSAAPP